jgi:hypothetical protein
MTTARKISLPGFRVKDGKVVRDLRRLSVCDRLKLRGSSRVRVKRAGDITVAAVAPASAGDRTDLQKTNPGADTLCVVCGVKPRGTGGKLTRCLDCLKVDADRDRQQRAARIVVQLEKIEPKISKRRQKAETKAPATKTCKALVSIERVRELLSYDLETGIFARRIAKGGNKAGAVAGFKRRDGYISIKIDGKEYLVHRLVWLCLNGRWPKGELDHVNGRKDDNRAANLREATRAENITNCGVRRDNQTGFRGVRRAHTCVDGSPRFDARITVAGKQFWLGMFATAKEASDAYQAAARMHYGQFVRAAQS